MEDKDKVRFIKVAVQHLREDRYRLPVAEVLNAMLNEGRQRDVTKNVVDIAQEPQKDDSALDKAMHMVLEPYVGRKDVTPHLPVRWRTGSTMSKCSRLGRTL